MSSMSTLAFNTVEGKYFDGKVSKSHSVQITIEPGGLLHIVGPDLRRSYPFADVRIASRVGNTPRHLFLPDGSKCEIADNEFVDALSARHGRGRWQRLVHTLESRLHYVLAASVVTVAMVWATVVFGIPALAERAAHALPPELDVQLGTGVLEALDKAILSASQLDPDNRERIRARFREITDSVQDEHVFRLEFRRGELLGANALALPSGIVVLTDELVDMSENDDELVAILAHEVGHVVQRHSMRQILQDSAVVLLIATITGDVSSITALSATLPTLLIQAEYSRKFETEADTFALAYLQSEGIPPHRFADIMTRMDGAYDDDDDIYQYLSSHPSTKDRIKRFHEPAPVAD